MCSNTAYFSTNSAAARKWLVLLIVIFFFATQSQPVAGDEVPKEEFNSSDIDARPDSDQQQQLPPNHHPDTDNGTNPIQPCSSHRSFLDRNHPLLITTIVGLTMILLLVVHSHLETKKALLPLKKKVVDSNRNLWKVTSAFENQEDELDHYKKIALAYDESKVKNESLEAELRLVKQVNEDNQDLIKRLKRNSVQSEKARVEVEGHLGRMAKQRDEATTMYMMLLDRHIDFLKTLQPIIQREWEKMEVNKGITTHVYKPPPTSVSASDFVQPPLKVNAKSRVRRLAEPEESTKAEKPRVSKEESPDNSDEDRRPPQSSKILGDPTASSSKKKGFFPSAYRKICRLLRKKKSVSTDVNRKPKRSARLVMTDGAERRPP